MPNKETKKQVRFNLRCAPGLTAEEAQRLHPGAVPVGEPERRWLPDGPDEFAYTGAFQHQQR